MGRSLFLQLLKLNLNEHTNIQYLQIPQNRLSLNWGLKRFPHFPSHFFFAHISGISWMSKKIISQNFFNPSTRFLHSQLIDFHNILLNKISTHLYTYLFIHFFLPHIIKNADENRRLSLFSFSFFIFSFFFLHFCQLNIDRKFVCSLKSFLYLYLFFFCWILLWYPQNLAFYILKYKAMEEKKTVQMTSTTSNSIKMINRSITCSYNFRFEFYAFVSIYIYTETHTYMYLTYFVMIACDTYSRKNHTSYQCESLVQVLDVYQKIYVHN